MLEMSVVERAQRHILYSYPAQQSLIEQCTQLVIATCCALLSAIMRRQFSLLAVHAVSAGYNKILRRVSQYRAIYLCKM